MGRFRKLLGKVRDRAVETLSDGSGAGQDRPERHPLDPVPEGWNRAIKESPKEDAGAGKLSIRFENLDLEVSVVKGTTLLDAALEAGADLNHYCGGMCSCGSCRLEILSGEVSPLDPMEETTLDIVREGEQDRLGCQTRAMGDIVVRVPDQDF